MKSQEIRKIAPEMDPLKMGMGWSLEDLNKPQIIIESTFGEKSSWKCSFITIC